MANKTIADHDQAPVVEEARVTTLELFFDLVFVFTITQLTAFLAESLSWEHLLQSFLIFIVLFWMYGGYAWLTNSVPPVTAGRQLLLIAGMAAFLICALAIPNAFHETGVAFGIGYLIVILVHGAMYVRAVGWKAARFVPMNFLSVAVIITAGFVNGPARYILWILAIGLHVLTSFLGTGLTFEIRVSHFVERHGLLLLVALGESILAIGAGSFELDVQFILAAIMGLILTAALWWIYFARDDEVARATMLARSGSARLRQALGAYFYAFIPMLFGIILLATGIHSSIEHLTSSLEPADAFAFGSGVGLYLLGTTVFRRASGIPGLNYRYIASGLAVLTGFIGTNLYAGLQFAGLILILVILILVEAHWSRAEGSVDGASAL
ncbi:MAG: low temperature requirement protein A [Chloroflexi bacterium]|nr:MAG: low temperature requirement protein A [Chloroflexota bacterium]